MGVMIECLGKIPHMCGKVGWISLPLHPIRPQMLQPHASAKRACNPPEANKRRCTDATHAVRHATAPAPTAISPVISPLLADYEWQSFAQHALQTPHGVALELARFLALKVQANDMDARIYSPSSAVDAAWHKLLLRPRLYLRVCTLLGCPPGDVVGHDPEGAVDRVQQQARYQATLGAYRVLYGPPAPELWPVDGRCWVGTNAAAPPDPTTGAGAEESISLRIVDSEGAEVYVKIKRTTPLRRLMNFFCKKWGISRSSVMFIFDGRRLEDERSTEDYEMEDDDVIEARIEQTGC